MMGSGRNTASGDGAWINTEQGQKLMARQRQAMGTLGLGVPKGPVENSCASHLAGWRLSFRLQPSLS